MSYTVVTYRLHLAPIKAILHVGLKSGSRYFQRVDPNRQAWKEVEAVRVGYGAMDDACIHCCHLELGSRHDRARLIDCAASHRSDGDSLCMKCWDVAQYKKCQKYAPNCNKLS